LELLKIITGREGIMMTALKKSKKQIIKRAAELGIAYEKKYQGCCQCTFTAIVDALRWGGLELIPKDMEEALFPGLSLLSGGAAMTTDGSCGGLSAGILAIGLAMGISREMQEDDRSTRRLGYGAAWNGIVDKYYEKYGSLICKDVQRKRFGKVWDLRIHEMSKEFVKTSGVFDIKDRTPERGVCLTPECTIAVAAKWATGYIVNEFEEGNLKGKYRVL
jgi:hypothetical protein